jgi:hypothetical protein
MANEQAKNASYDKLVEAEEDSSRCDAFYDGESGIVRVFQLNFAELIKNQQRGLLYFSLLFCFPLMGILILINGYPAGFIWACVVWYFTIRQLQQLSKQTNHENQHVAVTTTGIRYDRHNFPTGASFRSTLYVRSFCC